MSQTLRWDADPGTAGVQTGTGDWLGGTNWLNGPINTAWVDGNEAFFQIGSGSNSRVTLDGPVTVSGIRVIGLIAFVDGTGSIAALPSGSTIVAPNNFDTQVPLSGTWTSNGFVNINSASPTATITAVTGDISLAGAGNSLGTVTVQPGARFFAQNDSTVATVTNNGQTFIWSRAAWTGTLTNNGTLDLSDATGNILTQNGGTTTLTSLGSTINGLITINGGALNVNRALSANGNVVIGTLGVMDVRNVLTAANVTNQGSVTVHSGGRITGLLTILGSTGAATIGGAVGGNVSNSGTLNLGGTIEGTLTQGGGDTFVIGTSQIDGALALNGGTVRVDNALTVGIRTDVGFGATLDINSTLNGPVNVASGGITRLSGTASGRVTLNGGTLTVDGNSSIGDGLVINDGTATVNSALQVSGPNSTNPVTVRDGGVLNVNATLTTDSVENFGIVNFNANLTGTLLNRANATAIVDAIIGGNLTNDGAATIRRVEGNVTTNGTLSFVANQLGIVTGNVTQTGGTVTLTGTSHFISGALAVNGGTFNADRQLTVTGGASVASGGTLDINDSIEGDITSAGTVTLAGIVVGNLTLTGGTATVDGAVTGFVSSRVTNQIVVQDGATLIVDLNRYLFHESTTVAEGGAVEIRSNATLRGLGNTYTNAGTLTLSNGGTISDEGAITNQATGVITFDGAGTMEADTDASGDEIVNEGTINFNGAAGDTVVVTTGGTGSFRNTGTIAIGAGRVDVTGVGDPGLINETGGALDLNGGTLVGNVRNEGIATLSGRIEGDFTQTDNFTSVDGVSTVTGAVAVEGGGFNLNSDLSVDGGVTVDPGATLNVVLANILTSDVTNGGLVFSTGTIVGNLTNTGTARIRRVEGNVANSGNVFFGNNGTGEITGSFTQTDGTTSLDGPNGSITGTLAVNGGTFNADRILTVTGGTTVGSGGTLNIDNEITSNVTSAGTVTLAGTVTGDLTLTGGTATVDGTVTGQSYSRVFGALSVQSGATLTVNGGRELWHATATVDQGGEMVIQGGATLRGFSNTYTNAGTLTIFSNGALRDAGAIINQATGVITFTGNGSLSGDTEGTGEVIVNNGTINFDGAGSVIVSTGAAGAFRNASGGTITIGAGTVDVVSVGSPGIISEAGATLDLNGGTITGNVDSEGTATLTGTIDGYLVQRGGVTTIDGASTITAYLEVIGGDFGIGAGLGLTVGDGTGTPSVDASGGTFDLAAGASITTNPATPGTGNVTFGAPVAVSFADGAAITTGTLNLNGTAAFTGLQTFTVPTVAFGAAGRADFTGNAATGDALTLTGAASFTAGSTIALDVDLADATLSTDTVTINGAATGTVAFTFNDVTALGATLTTGTTQFFTASDTSGLTASFGPITSPDPNYSFSVVPVGTTGFAIRAGVSGPFLSVANSIHGTGMLLSSMAAGPDRVPEIAALDGDGGPCAPRAWARLTGGSAEMRSATSSATTAGRADIDASLGGVQIGLDNSCLGREFDTSTRSTVIGLWDPLESTCRHASLSIL